MKGLIACKTRITETEDSKGRRRTHCPAYPFIPSTDPSMCTTVLQPLQNFSCVALKHVYRLDLHLFIDLSLHFAPHLNQQILVQ